MSRLARILLMALGALALCAPPTLGATGGAQAPDVTTTTPPTTTYAPPAAGAPGAVTAPNTATTPGATTAPTVGVPTTALPQSAVPAQTTTQPSRPARGGNRSEGDDGLSTGALVIAAAGALLLLACLAWALARRRALEPHWLLSLRHSMAEAGFRASATWSEFADWVRLGR